MSELQKLDKAASPEPDTALYVYGIGTREELAPLMADALPDPLEDGASLELVSNGELAAIVSAVPLADYAGDALETRLQDLEWTAPRAMRHERVVEHFAAQAGVIPLRFGTIYLRREGVEEMLKCREAALLPRLDRLRGREEWSLNLYCDRAKWAAHAASSRPELREASERASAASPGQAYLLRKKMEGQRAEAVRRELARAAAEIEGSLGEASEGAHRLRLSAEEPSERGEVVMKIAYLVGRDRFDGFRAAAERLAREYAPAGLTLELMGPWPAYHFADDDPSPTPLQGRTP